MANPRTGHINSTENTVKQIKSILATAQTTWTCSVFSGTSAEDMRGLLPGLVLPAAIVRYVDSQWKVDGAWRRSTYEVALICANSDIESAGTSIRGMIDSAVAALDSQVYNQAFIWADSDSVIDLGPNKAAAILKIIVEDM